MSFADDVSAGTLSTEMSGSVVSTPRHVPSRKASLDDVSFASRESHEEAIKKTLELMDSREKAKPGKSSCPVAVKSYQQDLPTVTASVTQTDSFLPSLSMAAAQPVTPDLGSGFSTPSSIQRRQRTTPQLPPPPSRHRPGPDFSRTILDVTVPEMSESNSSLLMHDAARGAARAAGEVRGSEGIARKKAGKKGKAEKRRSELSAPQDRLLTSSASPVAIVSPIPASTQQQWTQSTRQQPSRPESFLTISPSEFSMSISTSRPFSILSSALSETANMDTLHKVLLDMTSLLETVLTNEKILVDLGGPDPGSSEHGTLKRITEALVAVHDQFTSKMKVLLENGLQDNVIDPDMQADISQVSKMLLHILSLLAAALS